MTELQLERGLIVWLKPGPTVGHEQAGRRPAVIISGADYLEAVTNLAVVVPITTIDRSWPNQVPVADVGFAMCEQVKAVDRARIVKTIGRADASTMLVISRWVRELLEL